MLKHGVRHRRLVILSTLAFVVVVLLAYLFSCFVGPTALGSMDSPSELVYLFNENCASKGELR